MDSAIVTGAGRRLGLYLVERLLFDSWRVFALSRGSSKELDGLRRIYGDRLSVITYGDIDAVSLQNAISKIRKMSTAIELIVNNASIFEKDVEHNGAERAYFAKLFEVHMQLPLFMMMEMRSALESSYIKKGRPSSIVNITDIYVDNPSSQHSLYSATKAGLESLSISYAKKYAPFCTVNTIKPGPIMFLSSHSVAEKDKVAQATLLETEPGFEPIFKMLMSIQNNNFVTGASFKVDGGRSVGKF